MGPVRLSRHHKTRMPSARDVPVEQDHVYPLVKRFTGFADGVRCPGLALAVVGSGIVLRTVS